MRAMMFDVVELRAQYVPRDIERSREFLSEIAHASRIGHSIANRAHQARSAFSCNRLRSSNPLEVPAHAIYCATCCSSCRARRRKENLLVKVGRWIARYANVVDVFDADARGFEAVTNRFNREARTMLAAIEALLLDGGNKPAIANEGRGCVA